MSGIWFLPGISGPLKGDSLAETVAGGICAPSVHWQIEVVDSSSNHWVGRLRAEDTPSAQRYYVQRVHLATECKRLWMGNAAVRPLRHLGFIYDFASIIALTREQKEHSRMADAHPLPNNDGASAFP